jgi:uncharacterized membrane protein YraQ (UPF0718 family)
MNHRYTLALIAAAIGGLCAMIGKYITALFSSSSDDRINLRETLLKRMNQLEKQINHLEERQIKIKKEQEKWVYRYWSLYRWTIKYCLVNQSDQMPPNFHEMETEEIKQAIHNMYTGGDLPDINP